MWIKHTNHYPLGLHPRAQYPAWTGYNLYRGVGSVLAIDYDNPIAHLHDVGAMTPPAHAASTRYFYALRAVRNGVEAPGIVAVTEFVTDAGGDWVGNRPAGVLNARVEQDAGGVIRILWNYRSNASRPSSFSLWHDIDEDVDTSGAADATESYYGDAIHTHDFTLTDGQVYWFAIAPVAGSIVGPVTIVGPICADATAQDAPKVQALSSF